MAPKTKAPVTNATTAPGELDLSAMSPAELQAMVLKLQADVAKAKEKPARAAKTPKTDEEKAAAAKKAEGKVAFETFNYATEGTDLFNLQMLGRGVHIYAFYKVIKFFSYDRLSNILYDLCVEAAEQADKTVAEVITQVTSRTPKEKKAAEAAETAGETTED